MKLVGTIQEWIHHNPNAVLTHPKLQEGIEVSQFEYHDHGFEMTYVSNHGDGPPMIPRMGSQMPYMVRGKVKYTAMFFFLVGGCVHAIPEDLAEDAMWYEIDSY